ncbi:MAG: hypothetical protein QG656_435, partial [Candidatus Hydrogenedentes bacterium]|nr:hypothetical protein [Candidatus Hydrogenedentota bacterium]
MKTVALSKPRASRRVVGAVLWALSAVSCLAFGADETVLLDDDFSQYRAGLFSSVLG